ncbi:MAG: hypothetical protein QOJ56_532 [Mycobacterium sp.]|nr:hypothetical protein [Mycobacterium sp.]
MQTPKTVAIGVALTAAAIALAPTAAAGMLIGNYEVETTRDPGHSWLWEVRKCRVEVPDCVHVQGTPRPNVQAEPWNADAHLANGRYTMVVDVPDGVRCTVYFLPSHDTYSRDMVTLQGSVDSVFDAGCGGAPGGTATYPFSLQRY